MKSCTINYAKAQQQSRKSYASAVGKDNQVNNFREIMAAAKNEDLAEEREKNYRLKDTGYLKIINVKND